MSLKYFGAAVALAARAGVHSQIFASERATVAQTIDGLRLTVDYARPRARGRANIYGGLEPYNSAWTLVLDPRAALFHTAHPDSTRDQIRAPIMPQTIPHTEILTWSFTSVGVNSTTLEMRWLDW